MARIRSIHPGLFTDEAYMSASMQARLLLPGLWCEAWDDGVIEWRPVRIKARLFPVDNVDVEALLLELVELEFLLRFEVEGRKYAAIRNFCKWQKPRSPSNSGVLPDSLRGYVDLPALPQQSEEPPTYPDEFPQNVETPQSELASFPQNAEIAPQKGGREEGRKG